MMIVIVQEVCSQIWATLYDYPSLKVTFLLHPPPPHHHY